MDMKLKTRILACVAVVLSVASLTGCDQIRRLAGRPTSADIEVIRQRIADDEAREQARLDSIKLAEARAAKDRADSIAAADSFALMGNYVRTPNRLHGIRKGTIDHRFYVAVGAFKQEANAQRLSDRYDQEKYHPTVIFTGTGLNVVLVSPTNRIQDAYRAFTEVKQNPLCPKEAWVLAADENWNEK